MYDFGASLTKSSLTSNKTKCCSRTHGKTFYKPSQTNEIVSDFKEII